MIGQFAKLLKILNSESNPSQISLALVCGMIMGLTPLWSLHNLLILFLAMVIAMNFSAVILSWIFFSGIGYLFDPQMEALGNTLLSTPAMQEMWLSLYNSDIARLFHFNNTLTLGSLLCAITLALPSYFLFNLLIVKYRSHLLAWVNKSKLVKFLKAGKLYKAYQELSARGVV